MIEIPVENELACACGAMEVVANVANAAKITAGSFILLGPYVCGFCEWLFRI